MYNLQQSLKYPHQYMTRNLDVRFYVKDDVHKTLTNKEMLNIEQSVEELYLNNLKEACVRERAYKENVMWRGRLYGDHKLVQKGRELETPSCDTLSRAYNKLASVWFFKAFFSSPKFPFFFTFFKTKIKKKKKKKIEQKKKKKKKVEVPKLRTGFRC